MSIFKDILCKGATGSLYEDTFLYKSGGSNDAETTAREANFLQAMEIVRVHITEDRYEHLQEKLRNRLEELREYTPRAEAHIRRIEDEKVREESRKAYADQTVSMMQGIGRIAMQLIRADYEVTDEMAILCANFYTGERKAEDD